MQESDRNPAKKTGRPRGSKSRSYPALLRNSDRAKEKYDSLKDKIECDGLVGEINLDRLADLALLQAEIEEIVAHQSTLPIEHRYIIDDAKAGMKKHPLQQILEAKQRYAVSLSKLLQAQVQDKKQGKKQASKEEDKRNSRFD
ncbi:hypothetical protein KS4_18200 [Poriferisphaera corsica]|uniref:Uncharacterized protein n=1 Tax=Poriferisphaera corsica TaxID=2528020 RepID=A0A517YU51_9BACT|nr:hypothetical protein [Poriferisphaera corsica]QDU33763.1 hypothetical protein KS4_18200 [Poriferisphaera corsica]